MLTCSFKGCASPTCNLLIYKAVHHLLLILYLNNKYLYILGICLFKEQIENNKKIMRISKDHDVKDQKETDRIKANGGKIIDGRVFKVINLTRCLGRNDLKDCGVISRPSVSSTKLYSNEYTLIIASDGVWDYMSGNQVLELVQKEGNATAETICKKIVKESLILSKDNISCIVAKF